MDEAVKYINGDDPYKALVYFLVVTVVALSGVILSLFFINKKQNEKNFDMLIRSIVAMKDYDTTINNQSSSIVDHEKSIKELINKFDDLKILIITNGK